MDMFLLRGERSLNGSLPVSGSKNAALPIMAAALAAHGPITLHGVPQLADVTTLASVLESLGCTTRRLPAGELELCVQNVEPCLAEYELVRRMRASVCVLGPLLARRGKAVVSLPGGCNIGHRPIDLHLKGLSALGAKISLDRGYVYATADRLRGAVIDLRGPAGSTVTGTCNVLTAATLARGKTVIQGAAREPEVVDLGGFLNAMGARITGLGTSVLEIDGVDALTGTSYRIIPDRIEAATLAMAAALTQGELTLCGVDQHHLLKVIEVLRETGVIIEPVGSDQLVCAGTTFPLRPLQVEAAAYPGLPTDVQAQLTALLSLANGTSHLVDTIFPDRFLHLPELSRLGARFERQGGSVTITGVPRLSGACVMASDLRASAALLLAGLAASGDTVIRRVYHLDRGYERLDAKLNSVGARIQRVHDCAENLPASLQVDASRWEPWPAEGEPLSAVATSNSLTNANDLSEAIATGEEMGNVVPPPRFLSRGAGVRPLSE